MRLLLEDNQRTEADNQIDHPQGRARDPMDRSEEAEDDPSQVLSLLDVGAVAKKGTVARTVRSSKPFEMPMAARSLRTTKGPMRKLRRRIGRKRRILH